MSKRKREDIQETDIAQDENQALRIKVSRLKVRISQGVDSLTSALKLARGFERQKMGRRQKQAARDPKKLLRLREEVIILRELDLTETAQNYLLKQMARTKRIGDSAPFQSLYGHDLKLEGPKSTAEANVLALLFKSSPVSQILPALMQDIQDVLGLSNVSEASRTYHGSTQSDTKKDENVVTQVFASQEPFEGFSDSSVYLDGVAESSPNRRLLASDNVSPKSSERPSRSAHDDTSVSLSGSEDDIPVNEELSADGSDVEMQQTSAKQLKISPRIAFLPSLSMGGYYSGSESDGYDFHDVGNDGIFPAQVRKNRRGQRERQRIAEKKYGSNAKHLQLKNKKGGRDEGWDARKGAIDRSGKDARRTHQSTRSNISSRTSDVKSSGAPYLKKEAESIHPSWEAARKKKKEYNNQMNVFAGKKIDFD